MDHTVYERKNTDLGSTSMTKSGGFSIKKRHRKLGALIGLAALAVPFAANLGTLGDAIHAVTGPQNVYESKLLNVKLETSQDKAKTTWDLEFDRSDMSVSEQTVKFKLDLEKAGLTDAEITQDGKVIDMREGIVDAVLKTQATHLILTAISSNEDKHDITLPVTELGLYNEENSENLLPTDNRSVDLTMAFEQVAEMAESFKEEAASSSETLTEAVAKEEKKSEEKSAKKAVRASAELQPDDTGSNGFLTGSPVPTGLGTVDVSNFTLDPATHTSATNGNTNNSGFQLYLNAPNKSVKYYDTQGTYNQVTHDESQNINVRKKFGVQPASIEVNQYSDDNLPNIPTDTADLYNVARSHYHHQYNRATQAGNNSSYMVEFYKGATPNTSANTSISVRYDHVGTYQGVADGQELSYPMGAVLTISNIKFTNKAEPFGANPEPRFIDIPNNLHSGIYYRGIDSLTVTMQFYAVDALTGAFTKLIDVQQTGMAEITFSSLNNFGGNGANPYDWEQTTTGIATGDKSERVAKLSTSDAANDAEQKSPDTVMNGSMNVTLATGGTRKVSYSTGHGMYTTTYAAQDGNFQDWIGAPTFERGSIAFYVSGTQHEFELFTGNGNTWQTFNASGNSPKPLPAPEKTVTTETDLLKAEKEVKTTDADKANWRYGALDQQNLEQALEPEKIGDDYYYKHFYYVLQDTYRVPQDSVAKPDKIVMTDTLPAGVTLYNAVTNDTPNAADIVVFNTDGSVLPATTTVQGQQVATYTSKVTTDANGIQTITITMTDPGLNLLNFDGNQFAWRFQVKTDAELADQKHGKVEFPNQATVETSLKTQPTNWVKTYEEPHDGLFKIIKEDNSGNALTGATFTLTNTDIDQTYEATVVNNVYSFSNLPSGHYEWEETAAPVGYKLDTTKHSFDLRYDDGTKAMILENATPEDDVYVSGDKNTYTYTLENTPVPLQLKLQKVSSDDESTPLEGATFTLQEFNKADTLATLNWNAESKTYDSTADLKPNTVYVVTETKAPEGYAALEAPVYIRFVPIMSNGNLIIRLDVSTTTNFASGTVSSTNITEMTNDVYVGQFKLTNNAKSIFPRVGGTGIQAYIGAGLIVMLIAGGAAWYIKRRQNQ